MDKTEKKEGVWLSYKSIDSNDVHRVFLSGVQANRIVRRFNKQHKQRVNYLQVQGVYESSLKITPDNRITILRGTKDAEVRKRTRYIPEGKTLRSVRDTFQHMSFHAAKLDNTVLVFCPITGICGTLEMPALPIALVYQHPLSAVKNALACIKAISGEDVVRRMERQVYAGMLLSFLRGKRLMREADGETTAAECNMVLQGAGNNILHDLCSTFARLWDNPNVWNKVPSLNVDWSVHAKANYGGVNIAQVLQAFTKIIWNTLEPLAMDAEDRGRYLTARRERAERGNVPSYIKIHSASAVQARNIRDAKSQARKLFDNIQYQLPVVTRALVSKIIKDLLILPQSSKDSAAEALEAASDKIPALQAAVAIELASVIKAAKNERILDEIGSFMQEVSPKPIKSIAEILEAKRIKREEKASNIKGGNNE